MAKRKTPRSHRKWMVSHHWEGGLVIVTVRRAYSQSWRPPIRALTARAAARRYIRGNLAGALSKAEIESDEIPSHDYMKKHYEHLHIWIRRAVRSAVIRIAN